MTPKDARMKKNKLDVKMNISLQAKSNRKYPVVEVPDKVKLMRKKTVAEKERTSHDLKERFELEKRLVQNYYYLENRRQPVLRHEILTVLVAKMIQKAGLRFDK